MRRFIAGLITAGALLGACGEGDDGPTVTEAGGATETADQEPLTATIAPAATAPPQTAELTSCDDVPRIEVASAGTLSGTENPDDIVMGVLLTYAAEHAETYGGLWIDRTAGGTLVVAFTDDPAPHREALLTRAPSADDVPASDPPPPITDPRPLGEREDVAIEVVQVRYSERELMAFQESLQPLYDETGLVSSGIFNDKNRVNVGLLDPTPQLLAEVAGLIPADALCAEITITPPRPDGPLDVIPAESTDPLVSCPAAGVPFPYSVWIDPPLVDGLDHPAADALREELANPSPETPDSGAPWVVLALDEQQALFASIGDTSMSTISFTSDGGLWRWSGSSSGEPCEPAVVLPEGLGSVDLTLDPSFAAPGPDDTTLHLLVTELACVGGEEPGDRLLVPQVVETESEVLIAVAVVVKQGPQECPGNPSVTMAIELAAPLGDRVIANGLTIPPQPLTP